MPTSSGPPAGDLQSLMSRLAGLESRMGDAGTDSHELAPPLPAAEAAAAAGSSSPPEPLLRSPPQDLELPASPPMVGSKRPLEDDEADQNKAADAPALTQSAKAAADEAAAERGGGAQPGTHHQAAAPSAAEDGGETREELVDRVKMLERRLLMLEGRDSPNKAPAPSGAPLMQQLPEHGLEQRPLVGLTNGANARSPAAAPLQQSPPPLTGLQELMNSLDSRYRAAGQPQQQQQIPSASAGSTGSVRSDLKDLLIRLNDLDSRPEWEGLSPHGAEAVPGLEAGGARGKAGPANGQTGAAFSFFQQAPASREGAGERQGALLARLAALDARLEAEMHSSNKTGPSAASLAVQSQHTNLMYALAALETKLEKAQDIDGEVFSTVDRQNAAIVTALARSYFRRSEAAERRAGTPAPLSRAPGGLVRTLARLEQALRAQEIASTPSRRSRRAPMRTSHNGGPELFPGPVKPGSRSSPEGSNAEGDRASRLYVDVLARLQRRSRTSSARTGSERTRSTSSGDIHCTSRVSDVATHLATIDEGQLESPLAGARGLAMPMPCLDLGVPAAALLPPPGAAGAAAAQGRMPGKQPPRPPRPAAGAMPPPPPIPTLSLTTPAAQGLQIDPLPLSLHYSPEPQKPMKHDSAAAASLPSDSAAASALAEAVGAEPEQPAPSSDAAVPDFAAGEPSNQQHPEAPAEGSSPAAGSVKEQLAAVQRQLAILHSSGQAVDPALLQNILGQLSTLTDKLPADDSPAKEVVSPKTS